MHTSSKEKLKTLKGNKYPAPRRSTLNDFRLKKKKVLAAFGSKKQADEYFRQYTINTTNECSISMAATLH